MTHVKFVISYFEISQSSSFNLLLFHRLADEPSDKAVTLPGHSGQRPVERRISAREEISAIGIRWAPHKLQSCHHYYRNIELGTSGGLLASVTLKACAIRSAYGFRSTFFRQQELEGRLGKDSSRNFFANIKASMPEPFPMMNDIKS